MFNCKIIKRYRPDDENSRDIKYTVEIHHHIVKRYLIEVNKELRKLISTGTTLSLVKPRDFVIYISIRIQIPDGIKHIAILRLYSCVSVCMRVL